MIDWVHSTTEQRKELYRAYRRLMTSEGLTWTYLFEAAFGHVRKVGFGYEDNFRAGKIDRGIANLLYRWLRNEHSSYADELDLTLETGGLRPGEGWEDFLDAHGRYEDLAAFLLPEPSIGLVRIARLEPVSLPVIPLMSYFCFEFTPPWPGQIIALQSFDRHWYPMPLNADGWPEAVGSGPNTLPHGVLSGLHPPLVEEEHEGRHGFAFLLGEADVIEAVTTLVPSGSGPINKWAHDQIAEALQKREQGWTLHRINLLFRA